MTTVDFPPKVSHSGIAQFPVQAVHPNEKIF